MSLEGKDGELKYAWGGVECFSLKDFEVGIDFHELLGLIAMKHGRFSQKKSSPT